MTFGVVALFKLQQLPCLPGAGCSAMIHGMKSAQHRRAIADHSGGARSNILYRVLQP
jgi:hypothetical protein